MYRRTQGWVKHLDFMVLDLLCVHLAFYSAYFIQNGISSPYSGESYANMLVFFSLAVLLTAVCLNTFKGVLKRGWYREVVITCKHIFVVVLMGMGYLFMSGKQIPRTFVFFMVILYAVLSYASRGLWKIHLREKLAEEGNRSLLVVTDSGQAEKVLRNVKENNLQMFQLKGVVVADVDRTGSTIGDVPVVADLKGAAAYACREWVDEVLVVLPETDGNARKLLQQFMEMGIVVHMSMPQAFNPYGQKQFMENICQYSVLTTSVRYVSDLQLLLKRSIDILIGFAGTIVSLALAVVLGPFIYIQSPGPIFFTQVRVGKNGRRFKMYKFRSMYMDAEEHKTELMQLNNISDGRMFKLDNDPRIIGSKCLPDGTVKKGLGNFIRDFSLDEFPQFFNVLKGDMSVVGTRPPTVDEWEKYELHHRKRLAIKPGITGLWQVSGRSNITDFEEVVRLDAEYISDWDIGKDIKIILKTVGIVLRREGAK